MPNHNPLNINLTPNPFKKQNSFSAKSDASNASSQGSAGIVLPKGIRNLIVANDNINIPINNNVNTANITNTNIKSTTTTLNKTIPINTINVNPLQNMMNTVQSITNPLSPQPTNPVCHIFNIFQNIFFFFFFFFVSQKLDHTVLYKRLKISKSL